LGCPLLVDTLYHQKDAFYLSSAKRGYRYGKYAEERPLISRLTLHAKSLSFQKIDGEELRVESDLPKDLRALYNQLKKI
jgi:23S rRNA-/tRNA-specific pseudouridylate synthase